MRNYILLALSIFALTACTGDGSERRIMRDSKGTHNEMMLVMDEGLWSGEFGNLVHDRLTKPIAGLPQDESMFDIHQVDYKAFGDLFETYKSIVLFEVNDTAEASYQLVYDQWAAPQIVAKFTAPSKLELARLFNQNENDLAAKFHEHDMEVLRRRVRRTAKVNLPPELKELGIKSMLLPDAYQLTQDKEGLKVFFAENIRTNQAIFFHVRSINDDAIPGADMIAIRDSILKVNFEGPSEGSYPGTERRVPPSLSTTDIDDNLAIELRGLWRTHGDFMGGPFLAYEIYDEENGVVLTADGFFYGPDSKKLKLMMELEVVLRSIKLN